MSIKRLLIIFALLAGSLLAQTTSTITGTIKDLTGAVVTSGKLTFTLRPSTDVTISGLARFTTQTITCLINGSGLVKALDGTSACVLTMNTALQPPGSGYLVSFWPYNVKTATIFMYAFSSSIDITTVVSTQSQLPSLGGVVDTFTNQTVGGNKSFSGSTSFPGGVTSLSSVNAGLFTNTQMNQYISSLVGGISGSLYNVVGFPGFATEGITGGVALPSTATVLQANGIAGYTTTLCNSLVRTVCNAVGVFGLGVAMANGSAAWGGNFVVNDEVGVTSNLIGHEIDLGVSGTPSLAQALEINLSPAHGISGTMPAGGAGISITATSPSTLKFPNAIYVERGAVSSAGMWLNGMCTSGTCNSAPIAFTGFDGGGVAHTANIAADTIGSVLLTPPTGAGVKQPARIFSTYPACAAGTEGTWATITDSSTTTAGATITGGGAHHVLGYCNSVNWLVVVGT